MSSVTMTLQFIISASVVIAAGVVMYRNMKPRPRPVDKGRYHR